jgi:two-component system, OmpR family, phosphate regulon sensor histidine kinase PhoR
MPQRRLLGQLSPAYLLLTSLAIGAIAWVAVHSFDGFALAGARTQLTAAGKFIESQLGDDPREARDESFAKLCRAFGETSGLRFIVVAGDGEVLIDTDPNRGLGDSWLDQPEVRHALAGHTDSAVHFHPQTGERDLNVAVPIRRAGQVLAAVHASQPLARVMLPVQEIRTRMILVSLALFAAAAVTIPLLSRRITLPLKEMRRAAERFARSELGYKLVVPETEELGGLAEALNQMAEQLQERIRTIVRQNNEQQAVLSSMVEGVLAVDNEQRVISLNKASGQLLGIDQVQAQGRSLQEVVRNADLRRFVSRALDCNEPIDDDVVVHGDHEGVLQARGAALHDALGRSIGAVVVLNDVTDFRRLEHIRRDFVANVSHELKTPITSIKGFVETLLDGAIHNPEDTERFLQIVAKQADRLDTIIEDLLSLSKIEQGEETRDIALESRPVKDVIESAVHNCQPKATERQIHVCTACDDEILAQMNPQLLEQAVINLLDNAIKYSEPASEVQVLASQFHNEVTITVSDRGCGIAAEHLPRIFERFYRVDKARSRKLGGTGLGLAIVKHIVQAHQGHVTVKSTAGVGSVFTIHLPLPALSRIPLSETDAERNVHLA